MSRRVRIIEDSSSGGTFVDKTPFGPVPWDILVFVALTGMGFAFSVQRYVQSHDLNSNSKRLLATQKHAVNPPPTVDLGCLEKALLTVRRHNTERELRLSGQFCHLSKADMRRFGGLTVKNLTTNRESTIFFHGDDNTFL